MLKLFQSKTVQISLSVIILTTVIFLLTEYIDFQFFVEKIHKIDYRFLLLSVFSLLFSYYFRVLRFKLILNEKNGMILFSISGIHYFMNKILPARTGEISLPLLLKKNLNINYSKGINALLFFRILDLFVMLILFLCSMFFIDLISNLNILIIVSAIVITIVPAFWIFFEPISNLLIHLLKKISSKIRTNKLQNIENYIIGIKNYRNKKSNLFFALISFISLLSWVLIYLYYFFIIKSFELDYSLYETIFAGSISNFTFILPVNSAGNIGPFEAAWGYGFYLLNVSKDISVPVGLFANIFATLTTSFIALFGFIYLKKKTSRTA